MVRPALRIYGTPLRQRLPEYGPARRTKPMFRCTMDKVHCEKLDWMSFAAQYGRDDSEFSYHSRLPLRSFAELSKGLRPSLKRGFGAVSSSGLTPME
jgi:hypothetical protein